MMFTLAIQTTFLLGTFSWVLAAHRSYNFVATPHTLDDFSPDCHTSSQRPMFLINGQFPGPTIEADEGDTVSVMLVNEHPFEKITIHFHGMHQKGTVYQDGVSGVTQCALAPYESQNLTFVADPPGTHFWHAHQSLLIGDGISGPMIVHDSNEEQLEYDEEFTVFLQDWYHITSNDQQDRLNVGEWVGTPQTLLINGKGVHSACQEGGESFGDLGMCLTSCNDTESLLERFQVEEGKTYRLRIINSGQLLPVNFAIAGHNLTIVEADGTLVEPVVVSSLDLSPGQRYSVLLTADQPNDSPYWIRTTARGRQVDLEGLAYVAYGSSKGLPAQDSKPDQPAWDDPDVGPALDASLFTANPESHEEFSALTMDVTRSLILVGTQGRLRARDNLVRWGVNGISNTRSSEPLIVKAKRQAEETDLFSPISGTVDVPEAPLATWNYTDVLDQPDGPGFYLDKVSPLVLRLQLGDVVDVVIQNTLTMSGMAEIHPWHLHGHTFWVIGQGEGNFDPLVDPANFNLVNPVLRDTATVWPKGWTALRFHATNPGVWSFHCHVLAHAILGMGLSVVISPEKLDPLPPTTDCTVEHGDASGSSQ